MKPYFLLSFLCLASVAFSQDSTFQLKDYKYRTTGFQALTLNVGLSGSYYKNERTNTNSKSSSFDAGPFSVYYYKIRSTNQVWEQFSASTLGAYSSSNNSDSFNNSYSNYKAFRNSLNTDWIRRMYKANGWFLEIGGALTAQLDNRTQKATPQNFRQNGFTVQGNVSFGVGKGRVEWVQDAQMALYILAGLSSQGLLDTKPTTETTTAFAQLITDIRNKRVFDFRRRRVYELTRIDSFLRTSRLVAKTNIRHFTTVNDNWAFAINPFRSSGSFWYVRVKPGVGYNRRFSNYAFTTPSSTAEIINTYPMVSPVAGYERYKPVSLKWQHNMGVSLAYIYTADHSQQNYVQGASTSVVKNTLESHDIELRSFYGWGFFPNSRTQLTSTVDLIARHSNVYDEYTVLPVVQVSADYFLGYQTFLSAGFNLRYTYSNYLSALAKRETYKAVSNEFSVRFTHYLF